MALTYARRYGILLDGVFVEWEQLSASDLRSLVPKHKSMKVEDTYGVLDDDRLTQEMQERAPDEAFQQSADVEATNEMLHNTFGTKRKLFIVTYHLPVVLRKHGPERWSAHWIEDDILARTPNSIAGDVNTVWIGVVTRECIDNATWEEAVRGAEPGSLSHASASSLSGLAGASDSASSSDPGSRAAEPFEASHEGRVIPTLAYAAPVGGKVVMMGEGSPAGSSVTISGMGSKPSDAAASQQADQQPATPLPVASSSTPNPATAAQQQGVPPLPPFAYSGNVTFQPEDMVAIAKALNAMDVIPIFLPTETHEGFAAYSLSVLKPALCNVLETGSQRVFPQASSITYQQQGWDFYRQTNESVSNVIMSQCERGDVIWTHDFHLCLVPKYLARWGREKHGIRPPQVFFMHSPFPTSEIFRTLAVRDELLDGMLECDVVGFHTFNYARHFLHACKRLLGLSFRSRRGGSLALDVDGRDVLVNISHVGVEAATLDRWMASESAAHVARMFAEKYRGKVVIAGMDTCQRLSGIALKMLAFERLLEENPVYRQKVVLVQRCELRHALSPDIQKTSLELRSRVAQINSIYGPVVDYEEAPSYSPMYRVGLFHRADILLSTPLREGLNLLPLEYVYVRTQWQIQRSKALAVGGTGGSSSGVGTPSNAHKGSETKLSSSAGASSLVHTVGAASSLQLSNAVSAAIDRAGADPGTAADGPSLNGAVPLHGEGVGMSVGSSASANSREAHAGGSVAAGSSPARGSPAGAAPPFQLGSSALQRQASDRRIRAGSTGEAPGAAQPIDSEVPRQPGSIGTAQIPQYTESTLKAMSTGMPAYYATISAPPSSSRSRGRAGLADLFSSPNGSPQPDAAGTPSQQQQQPPGSTPSRAAGGVTIVGSPATTSVVPSTLTPQTTRSTLVSGSAYRDSGATTATAPGSPITAVFSGSPRTTAGESPAATGQQQLQQPGTPKLDGRPGQISIGVAKDDISSLVAPLPPPTRGGCVILSEFATATSVLNSNLVCNPWNIRQVAREIDKALLMQDHERSFRQWRDYQYAIRKPAALWSRACISDVIEIRAERDNATSLEPRPSAALTNAAILASVGGSTSAVPGSFRVAGSTQAQSGLQAAAEVERSPVPLLDIEAVAKSYKAAKRRLVIFDYGGTLITRPKGGFSRHLFQLEGYAQSMPMQVIEALAKIARDAGTVMYVVSGLRSSTLEALLLSRVPHIGLAAENAMFVSHPSAGDDGNQPHQHDNSSGGSHPQPPPGQLPHITVPPAIGSSTASAEQSRAAHGSATGGDAAAAAHASHTRQYPPNADVVADADTLAYELSDVFGSPSSTVPVEATPAPTPASGSAGATTADLAAIAGTASPAVGPAIVGSQRATGAGIIGSAASLVTEVASGSSATPMVMATPNAVLHEWPTEGTQPSSVATPVPSSFRQHHLQQHASGLPQTGHVQLRGTTIPSDHVASSSGPGTTGGGGSTRHRTWVTLNPEETAKLEEWGPVKAQAIQIMTDYAWRVNGSVVREYDALVAWDFKSADAEWAQAQAKFVAQDLERLASDAHHVKVTLRKTRVEVSLRGMSKGNLVQHALEEMGPEGADFILCVGDDTTDEDVFSAVARWSTSHKQQLHAGEAGDKTTISPAVFTATVGKKTQTAAQYWCVDVPMVQQLILAMVAQ